ncbi:hypothetical protein GKD14_15210 [Paeniclostridium sordellii]|nr:hypothetical protein [Paeniclostridium sordellii]MSB60290.1 hypothetical protein [Paeniclostridium sordellii]
MRVKGKNIFYAEILSLGRFLCILWRNIWEKLYKDLESEYYARASYKRHIEIIDDDYIRKILQRKILDEKVHIKHFKSAIKKYCN